MKFGKSVFVGMIAAASLGSNLAQAEITANAGITNNYLWRGLTQSDNNAAIQGGFDYTNESGFYAGTWASNVNYGAGDDFSYEHDVYFGFAGEAGAISYDVGYLYYNYDSDAKFDFGEIYGTLGVAGFSATLYLLTNTEADEPTGLDFDAFGTYYASLDYGVSLTEALELGLHVGHHDGDFNEAFNGVPGSYTDYSVSLTKGDITFTISDTDLSESSDDNGLNNDEVKFVISWSTTIE